MSTSAQTVQLLTVLKIYRTTAPYFGIINFFSALRGKACISSWEACDGFNDCFTDSEVSVDELPEVCQNLPATQCTDNEVTLPYFNVSYPILYLIKSIIMFVLCSSNARTSRTRVFPARFGVTGLKTALMVQTKTIFVR